jgi:hypothetical protein
MALGSCFTENIGNRLSALKYDIDINPFGIQYNPASIAQGLNHIISGKAVELSALFEYNDNWHSFSYHSDFSDQNPEKALIKMNKRLENAANSISKTNFLMITLGTAWIFTSKENSLVVNNCHKLPADKFTRKRLSVEETVDELKKPLEILCSSNPNLQIILSISPIRHLKDGLHENQLSKATLLIAAEKLCSAFKNMYYFPAYEMLMDDLRDYRFYATDMTHPSNLAIDYIWEKFETSCLLAEENKLRKDLSAISEAVNHRLFNPNSENSRKFAAAQLKNIEAIQKQASFINLEQELNYFNSILNNLT